MRKPSTTIGILLLSIFFLLTGFFVSAQTIPAKIEAESFVSKTGTVAAETVRDPDGGTQQLGYFAAGNSVTYPITVKNNGVYTINLRYASGPSTTATLKKGTTELAKIPIPTKSTSSSWYQENAAWGNATADIQLSAGTYEITLVSDGGGFNLNWIEFTAKTILYNVTVNVKEGANPFTGASVVFNSQTKTSGTDGSVVFTASSGTYNYAISSSGYITQNGSATIANDTTLQISIQKDLAKLSFNISNGTTGISGAKISINGIEKTSDANGGANFDLPRGFYTYSILATDYNVVTSNVYLSAAKTMDVAMDRRISPAGTYDVTINVTDGSTALNGATVKINGVTKTVTNGSVVFTLADGIHTYLVANPGYFPEQKEFSLTQNSTRTVSLQKFTASGPYTITIKTVNAADNTVLYGATVTISDKTQTTSANGVTSFVFTPGSYNFSVKIDSFYLKEGTISVTSTRTVTVPLTKIRTRKTNTPWPVLLPTNNPVADYGQLQAKNGYIFSSKLNRPVQVKGVSLYWNVYGGEDFWNGSVVNNLKNNWKSQILRIAMSVEDRNGYLSDQWRNQSMVENMVNEGVSKGMYVIIDWHSHFSVTANGDNSAQAKVFFGEMAKKFGHLDNVIFELYNEPKQAQDGITWERLKAYADNIIPEIRKYSDNLIIMGTKDWSQRVDEPILNPIKDNNIAYAFHFYAADHSVDLRNFVEMAQSEGFSVFVSEWGFWNKNGGWNQAIVDDWINWMDKRGLSWACWSTFRGPATQSCMLGGGANNDGSNWDGNLTEWGNYAKNHVMNYPNNPNQCKDLGRNTDTLIATPIDKLIDNVNDNDIISFWGGKWDSNDDKGSKGASTITAAADMPTDGHIKATYNLSKGDNQYDPYCGVGLKLKADATAGALTGCKEIRYDYKGVGHVFKLEHTTVENGAQFQSKLVTKSDDWKTVVLKWDQFAQPYWNNLPVTFDITKVNRLSWNVGGTSGSGTLEIDNVACIDAVPSVPVTIPYVVTLTVLGEDTPLANASVTLDGKTKTSNASGVVSFGLTAKGDYKAVITAASYTTSSVTISVNDYETTKTIILDNGLGVPNIPPFSNAGLNQVLSTSTTEYALMGNKSWDHDGGLLTFNWTEISGLGSVIKNATDSNTVITGLTPGNTYKFALKVSDGTDFTFDTILVVIKGTESQDISLSKGWNLVSFSIIPSSNDIATIFPNATYVKTQTAFYGSTNKPALNSLTSITAGQGYLVYNTISEKITIKGSKGMSNPVQLVAGWNLVGVPISTAVLISTLSPKIEVIKDFGGFYKTNNTLSSLTELKTTKAYFIKASEPIIITFE